MSFVSKRYAPAQQGHLDGFCGVYTGLNFFCRRLKIADPENDQKSKKIFRQILKELDGQGRLTVHRICEGFLEGQLQKAFNKVARLNRIPIQVKRLQSYLESETEAVFDAVARLDNGEAAMLSMNRGHHWVLAFDCDGRTMQVDDSSMEPQTVSWSREESRSLGLSRKDGLVFLNA